MQVKDEAEWDILVRDLKADGEEGQLFLQFLTQWCDQAEKVLGQNTDIHPLDALRQTLIETEEILKSRKNILIIGQLMAVAHMHWAFCDDETLGGLTEIELRLIQDVLAIKIAHMEDLAESAGNTSES